MQPEATVPFAMMKRRSISSSTFLVIATLAVAAPVISFAVYLIFYVAAQERSRAELEAVEVAGQVREAVDGELMRLLASLDGLASSSALAAWDLKSFHDEARRLVAGRDHVLLLRDFDQNQFVNSEVEFGSPLPQAVPMEERERRALEAGKEVISGVYASPLSGEPRIAVARSIKRGQSTYVLGLTAPTSQLRDVLLRAAPRGWLVGVGDDAGRYVTRSSRHSDVSGKPTDPAYNARLVGASGTLVSSNLDGVMSLAGYVRSPFSGWVYAANIPYSEVTAPLRRSLALLAGLGLLTLAASLGITYLFSRRFADATARLAGQARALGAGRRTQPLLFGLTEFREVSDALVLAGAAIEERSLERERSREREALLGSVLDAADLHVGVVIVHGGVAQLVVASREANEFFSRLEGPQGNLLHAAGLAEWAAALTRAAEAAHPVSAEYAIRTDHGVRHFTGTFVRLPGPSNAARVAFTANDITARFAAEEMARARSHELETVLSTVPAGVWFTYDRHAGRTIRNRFASDLMRGAKIEIYSPANPSPAADGVQFYADGKPLGEADMPLRKAMRGKALEEQEYEFHFGDGSKKTVLMSATALRDQAGKVVGAVAVGLDISERKRAEDQRRLLINELNHRVKNTLASVQSLVTQSLKGATSPSHATKIVSERLMALAKAHDILTRESWVGANLRDVVNACIAAYPEPERVRQGGPDAWLKPSVGLAFAMALHELLTNAIKYGSLSNAAGTVSIEWSVPEPGSIVHLEWRESGGPAVAAPERRGFGSRLIERSFASEQGGRAEVRFEPRGVVCVIEAPVEARATMMPGSVTEIG